MKKTLVFVAMLGGWASAAQAAYEVKRVGDGNFTLDISGIKINDGSSLKRETVLLNNPASTVEVVSGSLSFTYAEHGFRFTGKTTAKITKPIKAIQIRHAVYDVFGKHMTNLANTEAKDYAPGEAKFDGEWRASEEYVTEALTNVVYVSRVRFDDGTQWVADFAEIGVQLEKLQLEKLADPKALDK